jgi:hypothetical protein
MPNVGPYKDKNKWMEDCVPETLDEGYDAEDGDQAVAICLDKWRRAKGESGMKPTLKPIESISGALGEINQYFREEYINVTKAITKLAESIEDNYPAPSDMAYRMIWEALQQDITPLFSSRTLSVTSTAFKSEKWIQDATTPGNEGELSRKLGIPEDEDIPMSRIQSELDKLHKKSKEAGGPGLTDSEQEFARQLAFAKAVKNNTSSKLTAGDILRIKADVPMKVIPSPERFESTNGGAAEDIVNFQDGGQLVIRSADDKYDNETHMFQHIVDIKATVNLGDSFGDKDHEQIVSDITNDVKAALIRAGAREEPGPQPAGAEPEEEPEEEPVEDEEASAIASEIESSVTDELIDRYLQDE